MTHLIPADAPPILQGQRRARCGDLVQATEHAAVPECPRCRALDEQDDAALDALRAMPPVPSEPVRLFNPIAGYRPRSVSRG